jgi:LmbE family N-acetylglucosaminyl deacetylase
MTETILCMAAHPDDEIIGCGGAIAKFSEEGKKVINIIFSIGDLSSPWLKKDYIISERRKESKEIDEYIGATETINLGFKDRTIEDELKTDKAKNIVRSLIKKYKPAKIFVHTGTDAHKDHRAVNKIIMDTIESIDRKHEISIFTYEVWNVRNELLPRMYVDISKTFRKKIEAMKKFRSQRNYVYFLMLPVIIRSRILGLQIGVKYAERFYKVR